MAIFGTGDYSYKTSSRSSRISLPASLSTPSTCFTSRVSSASACTSYKTPFSRYDRSRSTPVRSMRSESPGHYYNRAVSEFNIPYSDNHLLSLRKYRPSFSKEKNMNTPILRLKKISDSPSSRLSYPNSRKIDKDHMARYSQRITDIFENNEDEEDTDIRDPSYKSFSKYTATQNRAFSTFVPKSNYKSVLEDAKFIEAKYKKMNEENEEKRPKTEFDHLRPSRQLNSLPSVINYPSKGNVTPSKCSENPSVSRRQSLIDKTLQLYKEAATPNQFSRKTMYNNRYLAANLSIAGYRRSSISNNEDFEAFKHKLPLPTNLPEKSPARSCSKRRNYTNRENSLARQLFEYIKKGERWTTTVERPFVLGI